jgi:hypothetical protein
MQALYMVAVHLQVKLLFAAVRDFSVQVRSFSAWRNVVIIIFTRGKAEKGLWACPI